MPKLHPALHAQAHKPGLVKITFPFDWKTINYLKTLPGCRYAPELGKGVWVAAEEMLDTIHRQTKKTGLRLVDDRPKPRVSQNSTKGIHKAARQFQKRIVSFGLTNKRIIVAAEAGTGKTFCGIMMAKLAKAENILVICPLAVLDQWVDEFDLWWPEHPEIRTCESKKEILDAHSWAPITITTYGVAKWFIHDSVETGVLPEWNAVIVDEAHMAKNRNAARSKTVLNIMEGQDDECSRILLTATPMDKPYDLWHQLHILHPGRPGTFWQFCHAYSNVHENPFGGADVEGVNEERIEELRERLKHVFIRVTKAEIADQLPPCTTQTIRLKSKRDFNPRELVEKFSKLDSHRSKGADALIRAAGEQKFGPISDYVKDAFDGSAHHILILTHLRESAEDLARLIEDKLKGEIPVRWVHGGLVKKERNARIKEIEKEPQGVLVATMGSTGIGLSLQAFPLQLFAEISYSLTIMEQAASRTHRLSSKERVHIVFFVLQGTHEESAAFQVGQKIEAVDQVIDSSEALKNVAAGMKEAEQSDEEFFAQIRSAASGMLEDEYV
jgi:SNF2 family DNA or RNA helicase